MPAEAISMRKLKEILRLKYEAKLAHRKIAKSLSISPGTVSIYVQRASLMGIHSWPLSGEWDDIRLHREFLRTKHSPRTAIVLPDWVQFHQELKRKGVTKQLLWQEYTERHPNNHYSYPQLCRHYKQWLRVLQPSMRQTHIAGEKLFIDYCGPTIPIVNPDTGECRFAQVFVAVFGASNYTYAEATESQKLKDWVMSHVRAFEFFGGTPELLVPDNLKSATTRACKYDPDLNPTYQQMAAHYRVGILPARPLKPKDKAKAENGVLVVERWIMAVLRRETFYTLTALNQRIKALLEKLNSKPFQKLEGCRQSLFDITDKPALKPLPLVPYQFTQIKKVRVNIDYHVEIEKHYYSVPHGLLRQTLEAHITEQVVMLYHHNQCVAQHRKMNKPGSHTTLPEHMPQSHREYSEWTPQRLLSWAQKLGAHVALWVQQQLDSKTHPQQRYRACLGLLNLSKHYPKERLDRACQRGLETGASRLKNIKTILKNRLDEQPVQGQLNDVISTVSHDNIRGNRYYH